MNFLRDDGTLEIARWADRSHRMLDVDPGPRDHPMYGTKATGEPLVSNGQLGVDVVRVPAGEGFAPHTHPGDHLLVVVAGDGTITYDGRIYPTEAGQVYLVEGSVPHAVGAITDHVILAVGSPHRPVDSADRMTLTAYDAVAAELGTLTCVACDATGRPDELRSIGCPHVPAEPSTGRPLVVGLAPASTGHEDRPAFVDTRSGRRLARLLDVEHERLLEVVDTVNVWPRWHSEPSRIPLRNLRASAAERVLPLVAGRVLIVCGQLVGAALGLSESTWGAAQVLDVDDGEPALAVQIPHPSGLSRAWNDRSVSSIVGRVLAVLPTLAAAGPLQSRWSAADVAALARLAEPA